MTKPTGETPMNSHARYLRLAAKDIADAGHNGWGNTCTWAATEIDRLERQLAERDRALKERDEWKKVVEGETKLSTQRLLGMCQRDARIAALEKERGEYKIWWERDSTALGKVLGELSNKRVVAEDFRALAATRQYRIEELEKALRAFENLIENSRGVVGLHLNGDEAPWAELRRGGRFEDWLVDFDAALAAQEKP